MSEPDKARPCFMSASRRSRAFSDSRSAFWAAYCAKSCWNGHYECTCYHPLFLFNQFGDLERCALRPGNVHSADGWESVLKPVVIRYKGKVTRIYFRGDAAFANPEIYEFLETEGIGYTIRLPANTVLQNRIGHLLKRPIGRPPHEVRATLPASAIKRRAGKSRGMWWQRSSGIRGSPACRLHLTNLARPAERIVAFCNHRGTPPTETLLAFAVMLG